MLLLVESLRIKIKTNDKSHVIYYFKYELHTVKQNFSTLGFITQILILVSCWY